MNVETAWGTEDTPWVEALPHIEASVEDYADKIEKIIQIGIAVSTVRDPEQLFSLILKTCREVTNADAGSLYIVETHPSGERFLKFQVSQNDSIPVNYTSFKIPVNRKSIAGYVAIKGHTLSIPDVYDLPDDTPFSINQNFDQATGYKTRSMLVVPMHNSQRELVGILQLINCKRRPHVKLTDLASVAHEVIPFGEMAKSLSHFLASQATIVLENSHLLSSIEHLFEGFVTASVTAIESRDPTTSGHSARVARLTLAFAEKINEIDTGEFKDIFFNEQQMKEIRYAAMLHDFGKVGVREHVLLKEKKLYPHQMEILEQRFAYAKRTLEARCINEKLNCLLAEGLEGKRRFPGIEQRYAQMLAFLDADLTMLKVANEPSVLPQDVSFRLWEIAEKRIEDLDGSQIALLTPKEFNMLKIPKGNLNEAERQEIESHVAHTRRFLDKIPWTKELKRVPNLAAMHHEKLDGTGYPGQLKSDQIFLEAKMMTITDIYDALTARDRPYKKAVSTEKALNILKDTATNGQIDVNLLDIFIHSKIYRLTQYI